MATLRRAAASPGHPPWSEPLTPGVAKWARPERRGGLQLPRPLGRLGDVSGHLAHGLHRPVVLGEDERGEIDLAGELDEPVEGRDTRVEDRRPRVDVGDTRGTRVLASAAELQRSDTGCHGPGPAYGGCVLTISPQSVSGCRHGGG